MAVFSLNPILMRSLLLLLLLTIPFLLPAQEAAESDPKERIEKRLRLADELEAQGDKEGALQILKELSELDEPNAGLGKEGADLQRRIGNILMESGRSQEAIPHLKRAIKSQGGEDDFKALGRGLLEAREYEAAVSLLEDAAKRFPESPDFPYLATFALGALERWDESIAQFEKTLELAKDASPRRIDKYFHYRHAAAHEKAGNFDKAEVLFRKTLELIKSNDSDGDASAFTPTVLNHLAYMWIERGENLDEAGEMAKKAAELDPDSGAIADTVGWWHFLKGDYPRALAELKKAERLIEQADPVIYDHLGQTCAKLNEKEIAAEYFRKALELDPRNEALKARLAEVTQ